jgi:5,10-methylenetetrahydrofolate reductase
VKTLFEKLTDRDEGICLYGITPPKQATEPSALAAIAQQQAERIGSLRADGLILYDIQDESERTKEPRPFPFLPTLSPEHYARDHLRAVQVPKIVYRAVTSDSRTTLAEWLAAVEASGEPRFSVLVGAPSSQLSTGRLKLSEAYALTRQCAPSLVLGGIAIAERHNRTFDEHHRMLAKMDHGCRFLVTQAVYDVTPTKSLLSDYALALDERGLQPIPIIVTFSPCGSARTLDFMKWLGISFPRWLENELRHSADILGESVTLAAGIFQELLDFARQKRIPLGINVESVSIRKPEIEASVELFHSLRAQFNS